MAATRQNSRRICVTPVRRPRRGLAPHCEHLPAAALNPDLGTPAAAPTPTGRFARRVDVDLGEHASATSPASA